jgi:hypothetical protein
MPYDPHGADDDEVEGASARRFDDFDCPSCAANNPYADGFAEGDEIHCFYCGQAYEVRVVSGKLKLREV